ncbi:MAG: amino acid adenylation domain-containing protein [Legionellaceae bacterium]|nr:amino acid adenylation domain-containing protein [Legionellaceae bacterium]
MQMDLRDKVTNQENTSLAPQEHQHIIYDWNKTEKEYPRDKTIHQLFEEQVRKTPNSIAVVFEDQQLTYKELNATANQLARFIRKQNPGELVAICMERSLEMIVDILGILKAGCAYVPIDPHYPQERIDYILQDTNVSLVLDNGLKDKPYRHESKQNLTPMSGPNDLAYVIYTSGTTGMPKGVMIEHNSVVNYVFNVSCYVSKEARRFDFSTNLAFDLSITTTLVPLLLSRTIVIYSGTLACVEDYIEHLRIHHIDFIKLTPSYLSQLFSCAEKVKVEQCFLGGEVVTRNQLTEIIKHARVIYDEYGPTETTVGVSIIQKNKAMYKGIGKLYSNCTAYVLDENLTSLPLGVMGELYVGGVGLARGYLNQPELTRERFIENPFAPGRLYKTGDLVRWLPDGNLEYIGRNDFQVKIRGYRIELGEVEHALLSCAGVKHAVVMASLIAKRYLSLSLRQMSTCLLRHVIHEN